jgi:MOSC domain-containing protein YiiM
MSSGEVVGIFLTAENGALPAPVDRARALAGKGLEGNRYFYADGDAPEGRSLTLIAAEALEAMARENEIELDAAASRRNVLTRGIDVNVLVGKRFSVGDVECRGIELCEPCSHLQSLTKPGVIKGLAHRGGLNADILSDGEITVGDRVTVQEN